MTPTRFLRWLFGLLLVGIHLQAAAAFTTNDVQTIGAAYNNAFYLASGTNGHFKDTQTGGVSYFWTQAEIMETIIDAYEWTGNPVYHGMITNFLNGFLKNQGSSWMYNIYNDDIMWAVLAFARGGVATGRTNYINIAKANFDACYARAWDNVLGGGLYWTSENWTKNACVNGPGAIAAYLLYEIYGDAGYLNKATAIYQWERSVLFNPATGAVYDAIGTNGVINTWASTYNQGTFIGAAHFLGQTNDAALAAQFTRMHLTRRGILPEYGISGNNSGFNAIFLRWFKRFVEDRDLHDRYRPWLQQNASAAWNVRRTRDNLSWCEWNQSTPLANNFSSWDCISSFSAMHAAEPPLASAVGAVPRYPVGHWPFDAASGTIASNVAWNGNHGIVNGAAWNANGRFNACLTFNGINSSVQVTNPVANDFTLSFWVRTTQTAGTPQWYNGAGLVDGDVPFTANDFGTALIGGKLGFGIGNPDTTIVSAANINDGAWHHCVATRQQSTGALRVYVDGVLQAVGTGTRNTLNGPSTLRVGSIASGGGFFNGSIDDLRIFSRTLSSDEVAALYQSTVVAPSTPPAQFTARPSGNAVQLMWSDAPRATTYNVKRSLVQGGPYSTVTNIAGSAFTDTSVLSNRHYYYVVSPVNPAGEGGNSGESAAVPSSLVTWFRADNLAGLTNGASVSLWTDLSGNGNHAVQDAQGYQPVYITNAVNGLPAIRFDAARNSHLWFYRPVQDDFTMILLFRSTQGIGTGLNFWQGAGLINGEQPGSVNDFGIALNANGQVLAGVGNPDTTIRSGTGFNNGQPQLVTFRRVRSTGAITLHVNGISVATASGGTQSLTHPNFLALGAQGVLNNYLTGDIAEVQIYSQALSDADRLAQERAMRCRFGISGGTLPPAPTALNGSAGHRKAFLNWVLSPGATEYTVWRSTNSVLHYQPAASGITASSHVDLEAIVGVTNYYRVTADNDCGTSVNSATVAVFLPKPSLEIQFNPGSVTLTWPDWASAWGLVTATNLTAPVMWEPVANTPTVSDGHHAVTIPITSEDRYFRLIGE